MNDDHLKTNISCSSFSEQYLHQLSLSSIAQCGLSQYLVVLYIFEIKFVLNQLISDFHIDDIWNFVPFCEFNCFHHLTIVCLLVSCFCIYTTSRKAFTKLVQVNLVLWSFIQYSHKFSLKYKENYYERELRAKY